MSEQCIARNCRNQTVGGRSYKTALCVKCKKDVSNRLPLYLTCVVCHASIFVQDKANGIRMVCSKKCSKKRSSLMAKERYRKDNPNKNKQCNHCKKNFTKEQLDKSERMFCSEKCYHLDRYRKLKIKKARKALTELLETYNEQ